MRAGSPSPQAKAYSPYAGRKYPTRVLWGDTHLHSANSGDAFTTGTRFTPEETYRISRGEEVISTTGLPARLPRPLDFVVISDHSEGLGLITQVYEGNPKLMGDSTLQRWGRMMKAGGAEAAAAVTEVIGAQASNTLPSVLTDPKVAGPLMMSVWQRAAVTADKYNDPGRFTTFIGFSGRRRRAATTCTATWCCATAQTGQDRYSRSVRGKARTPSSFGTGWPRTSSVPGAVCSRFRTTATCRTAACTLRRPSAARR